MDLKTAEEIVASEYEHDDGLDDESLAVAGWLVLKRLDAARAGREHIVALIAALETEAQTEQVRAVRAMGSRIRHQIEVLRTALDVYDTADRSTP